MVGSGSLTVAAAVTPIRPDATVLLHRVFVVATAAHVVMLLLEYLGKHQSRAAAAAAHMVTHGRYARLFWGTGVVLAAVAAAVAATGWDGGSVVPAAVAGLAVQVALLAYESVFVRAGQDVPLS
jgi:hypothetical protein